MGSRIDAEFGSNNIHELVRDKAQERIDKVADTIIGKQIDSKITPKINSVVSQLGNVESNLALATTVTAALNDDRKAFEQLQRWANDKSYPLHNQAEQSLRVVFARATTDYLVASFNYPWKPGIDMSKLTISDIQREYPPSSGMSLDKDAIIYAANNSDNISVKDKTKFFVTVISTDQSLDAVQSAIKDTNIFSKSTF